MRQLRARVRAMVVIVGFLLLAGMGYPARVVAGCADPQDGDNVTDRTSIEVGDKVGRVLKVGPKRGEIRIDFGRTKGAEVGMRLDVRHTDPNRKPDDDAREVHVGVVELISVDDRASIARREFEPTELFGGRPRREIRPGDDVLNATDLESFRVLKLATGDDPGAIRELRKTRVDLARRRLEITRAFYENGVLTIDRYIDASQALRDAQTDMASTPDARIAAVRAHLVRMSRLADNEARRFADGDGFLVSLSEARAAQAEAALKLAEATQARGVEPAEPPARGDEKPPKAEQAAPDRPKPVVGDYVGRVTKFDRGRAEVHVDFGRAEGAEVGMRLAVHPEYDPKELDMFGLPPDLPDLVAHLDITSIEEHKSIARVFAWQTGRRGKAPSGREIQLGDRVRCHSDQESGRILKLGTEGSPDAIGELRRSRLRDARELLELATAFLQNGTITGDRYFAASRRLMEAERDASSSRDQELAAILGHLKRLTLYIEREVNTYVLDHMSEPQLTEARYHQAATAILMVKSKP
jgi:hypothetical protein